jgi:uncharacterized membrane protein
VSVNIFRDYIIPLICVFEIIDFSFCHISELCKHVILLHSLQNLYVAPFAILCILEPDDSILSESRFTHDCVLDYPKFAAFIFQYSQYSINFSLSSAVIAIMTRPVCKKWSNAQKAQLALVHAKCLGAETPTLVEVDTTSDADTMNLKSSLISTQKELLTTKLALGSTNNILVETQNQLQVAEEQNAQLVKTCGTFGTCSCK